MEIVTANKLNIVDKDKINGVYGDILDLEELGIDIIGITYDDKWSVKRFLHYLKNKDKVMGVFNFLGLDDNILKMNLADLSNSEFKWILLAYSLINEQEIIIFDYFDVGLHYKEQKKLIGIIKELKREGKEILVISNNLVFLSKVIDYFYVIKHDRIYYEGKIEDCTNSRIIDEADITKFIKLANKKNAKLEFVLDNNELLKNIYRSVK